MAQNTNKPLLDTNTQITPPPTPATDSKPTSDLKLPELEKPAPKALGSTIEDTPVSSALVTEPVVNTPTVPPKPTPQPLPQPPIAPVVEEKKIVSPEPVTTKPLETSTVTPPTLASAPVLEKPIIKPEPVKPVTPVLDLASDKPEPLIAQPLPPSITSTPITNSPVSPPPSITPPAFPGSSIGNSQPTNVMPPVSQSPLNPIPIPTPVNAFSAPQPSVTPNPAPMTPPAFTPPTAPAPIHPSVQPLGSPHVEQPTIHEPDPVVGKSSLLKKLAIGIVLIALAVSAAGAAWFAMKTLGSKPEPVNIVNNRRSIAPRATEEPVESATPEPESETTDLEVSQLPEVFVDFYQVKSTTPPESWLSLGQAQLFSINFPQEWSQQTETLTAEDGSTQEVHRLTLTTPDDSDFSDNNSIQLEVVDKNNARAKVGQENVNQSVGQISDQDVWITSSPEGSTPMITYIVPVSETQMLLIDVKVIDSNAWNEQKGLFLSVLGSLKMVD